jgi:DNA-binding SARP family transcriptional activator
MAPEHAVEGVVVDDFVGELLPGWDEEWLIGERERARQQCVHVLEAICRQMTDAGRAAEAIDAGVAAVAIDPLRESAQRVLISAHLAEGNVSEARRQFDGYCSLLRTELGVDPSPLLTALVGATRAA